MKRLAVFALAILAGGSLAGCDSGGNPPRCRFDNPAALATSSWPKFRHDLQNTGAIENVRFASEPAIRATFNAPVALGSSPTLGNGAAPGSGLDRRVYIGSLGGRLHALDADTLEELPSSEFSFGTNAPIRSTPLVALRLEEEALFVGTDDGRLYGLTQTGANQPNFWPFTYGAVINASPAINNSDGTLYTGAVNRSFFAVCPNGVQRFSFSSTGSFESSPAVAADGRVVVGGGDRNLRGFESNGFTLFSTSTAAAVRNAPVIELEADNMTTRAIYVVDESARLHKLSELGRPLRSVQLPIAGSAGSDGTPLPSPALALDHLYVADPRQGALLAIDTETLAIDWRVETGGPLNSSPAVAVQGGQRTVVVGSDDGNVYFIDDAGETAGDVRTVDAGAALRSSPAIRRFDNGIGAVYIATTDQRLLLIQ